MLAYPFAYSEELYANELGDHMGIDEAIDRIKEATGVKTQKELADLLDVPQPSISDAKKKGSLPAVWLVKLCNSYDLNPKWVQDGIGPKFIGRGSEAESASSETQDMRPHEPSCACQPEKVEERENGDLQMPVLDDPEPDKYNWVPMVEAELSAGGGSLLASEKIKDYYAFRKPFIRNIATSAKNLVLMRVSGDSMDPEIRHGATVMIDLGRKRIKNNCIFALGIQDSIIIKELELLPGGSVRIISKNRNEYPAYEAEASELRIIGQVVWGDRLYPI